MRESEGVREEEREREKEKESKNKLERVRQRKSEERVSDCKIVREYEQRVSMC